MTKTKASGKTRKRASVSAVPKTIVEQATLSLVDLPEKDRDSVLLREAVEQLFEPITTALAKGYSQEEVASLLSDRGIGISPASLRYYLLRFRRKAKATLSSSKTKKTRRTKAKAAPTESAIATIESAPNADKVKPTSASSTAESVAEKSSPRGRTQTKSKAPARKTSNADTKPTSKTRIGSRKK